MSDDEYQKVIEEGAKLKKLQAEEESPEVVASNPTLSISDIDAEPPEYPLEVEEDAFKSGIRLVTHDVSSSGIAYVDFGLDVSMIPYTDVPLLTALISLMNEAGTSDMSAADFRYVLLVVVLWRSSQNAWYLIHLCTLVVVLFIRFLLKESCWNSDRRSNRISVNDVGQTNWLGR